MTIKGAEIRDVRRSMEKMTIRSFRQRTSALYPGELKALKTYVGGI